MIGAEHILRTPLIPYRPSKTQTSARIFLKPENLQPFGSYKIRGILSAAAQADPARLQQGLVAASAGNMAQAVGFAAQLVKVPCKIYLPDSAPMVKKTAIQRLGAEIVEMPFPELWAMVQDNRRQQNEKGIFIHPVFTKGLLEGYGTIGEEILTDLADVDAVVIPFGVGGLTTGVANALRKRKPNVAVYACEPATSAPLRASLQAGKAMKVNRIPSFVDAIGVPEVLPDVFEVVHPLVTDSIVISVEDAKSAVAELYYQHKLVAEGAGGVALAAAVQVAQATGHRNIACIISGGNISPDVMKEIISMN